MADSNLPSLTPEHTHTILVIRSISTILTDLFPQAGERVTARRDTRLQILDDLSLLFVRGNFDGKDVVAVTPLLDNNRITLETMHAEADESRLDVVGTATESHSTQQALSKAYRRLAPSSKTLFSTVRNG
ncbi:hypothetical protein FRC00_004368, partial [Tulasnella sp. 408]